MALIGALKSCPCLPAGARQEKIPRERKRDQMGGLAHGYMSIDARGESMNPVGKALWYIESHFAEEITLDEIAAVGGVSRYHMSRAFSAATGQSALRHVRGRRLSEAARSLAKGAPDILA